jgi:LPXTG-motif cell wall-anchored protein
VATLTTAKYGEDIYFIGANGTYDTLGSSHDGNLGSYFPLYLYAIETTGGSGNEGTGNEGTGNEGTGNEGTGNEGTGNEGGNTQTPVAPKPFVPSTGVDTPVAGTAFKLGLYQKNVEKYLYFNNTTPSADRPYYQGTTDKFAEAVDVFAEAVEGGYKLYFMDGTTKTYIDIYQNGTYVNLRLTTEPTAVFTWNTEHKTFVTKIGEDEYYIGTYDKFETISACKLSKIADSFASHLYAKEPAKTGDNSVISVAVAAAVLSIMGAAVLVSKKKEF